MDRLTTYCRLLAYQLDLIMPGNCPDEASSRNAMRDIFSLRYTPRGRPVSSQRLRTRLGDELRGSFDSFMAAVNRSSIGFSRSRTMALSDARRGPYCFASLARRLFFSTELVLAIVYLRLNSRTGRKNRAATLLLRRRSWPSCR